MKKKLKEMRGIQRNKRNVYENYIYIYIKFKKRRKAIFK